MIRQSLIVCGMLLALSLSADAAPKKKKNKKKDVAGRALQPWEVDTLIQPIPINRQLFTGKVEKELRGSDARDGAVDNYIFMIDSATSNKITRGILRDVPLLTIHIENLPADHAKKIAYHRAVENMVRRFNTMSWVNVDANYFRRSVENMEGLILATESKTVDAFVKQNANIYTLDNSEMLNDYPQAKAHVYEVVGKQKPEMMIKRLPEIAGETYADPIVAAAAKTMPGTILNYATSTSRLSSVVRRNIDPLVQSIVRIATESRNPLKALPFLGDIYNKRKTVAQVDAFASNDVTYFKNLVRLKTENETMASDVVDNELQYRSLQFVRKINELHEAPDATRFKSIQPFEPEELYVMMIAGQDEIYTSSFVNGTFKQMMQKMGKTTGDELLNKMHKYHFRTFIRMCAGYNTLSTFFGTFEESKKNALMKEFVAGLEKGEEDELEDAVDVADAFGSITDQQLVAFLKDEVKQNYERVYKANNAESVKGVKIYGLLATIFNSADNSSQLSSELSSIPPITYVPDDALRNDKNEVVVQTFFYGDEDGKSSYESFKTNFPTAKWKKTENKYWVTYKSTGEKPVIVYANLPHSEPKDEEAQRKLQEYLSENEITPTMVIHRGHSYHLQGSLKNLTPDVKVVMLGSCGGYHNLANVLDKSPDANIISSKQTGAKSVNEPIIRELFNQITAGKDINWITSWTSLEQYFSKRSSAEKDLFSDYIPPNRNLGAIFIKAYRKLSVDDEEQEG